MDAKISGKSHYLYDPVVSDLKAVEKRNMEWDLNDWRWDGDLFTATPLNSVSSDCRSRQFFPIGPEINTNGGLTSCSDNNGLGKDKGKRELEKRRRVVAVEDEDFIDEAGSLNLKLGAQAYPIMDEDAKSGKKNKISGNASNHAICQVEDCKADLSNAKDYHRRHKVCDLHSKASKALVGNVMQRFCQQCSRFHVLQEFDEGKRSCRRRLAGHNKRRRKTHPENVANGGSLNDEKGSSYLLISLLRILSNMHSNSSDQTKDQDLLSHLLRNLANPAGTTSGRSISEVLQGLASAGTGNLERVSHRITNGSEPAGPSTLASKKNDRSKSPDTARPLGQCGTVSHSDLAQKSLLINNIPSGAPEVMLGSQSTSLFPSSCMLRAKVTEPETVLGGRIKFKNIDLNNVYDGSQDCIGNTERSLASVNPGTESISYPSWMLSELHKASPQPISGNSDSTSSQSPSSSSGDTQNRTNRIVFKLFGKDPNDFPIALRTQILDWLSHSPTDIESYIRPGCIVLTIYLHLGKPQWQEISLQLGASLTRLLDSTDDSFWKTGWIYARVQHSLSFIYNGQVVLDTPLPQKSHRRILSIKPIAVTISERTRFVVKGFNICRPTTRLLCAIEGKCLVQETSYDLMEGVDATSEHDKLQFLSFHCSIPNVTGRGFIEVEDHCLSSSFFPFIVAEQEVCSEICALEEAIEVNEAAEAKHKHPERIEAKNEALDFIHEMGWLLHRSRSKCRLRHLDPNSNLFPFKRYKWLIEFSMEHDWCAVLKKLLAAIFDGIIDTEQYSSTELALSEMGLLHQAVRRNCRPMVEMLLRYVPGKQEVTSGEQKQVMDGRYNFIFKPDAIGPAGLTPLHVAASKDGSENVLDALTDDPGMVGIKAWKITRDSTGLTPNDYACLRGHSSYIRLIQKKINKKAEHGHVVLDIPRTFLDCSTKQIEGLRTSKVAGLEIGTMGMNKMQQGCKLCEQKLQFGQRRTSLAYRPAMLSMVTIAAVCVCVALLFKSSPKVLYVFQPFRWELLKYGSS